jgi:hypothetical protein
MYLRLSFLRSSNVHGVLVAALATFGMLTVFPHGAGATVITHQVRPSDVPDETPPRGVNTAPAGFGADAWQGPASGPGNKSNWHARYQADGDALSILFPADAPTLTLGDIASISYYTYRPGGQVSAGQDWWIQIYTRPNQTGVTDDQAAWYGRRFINNYNDHTDTDAWTQYSTDTGMTFNANDGLPSGEMDLATLQASYGSRLVEMISIQTDSGWDGFDGYIDGLVITLKNGNVGRVNLTAIPEPASLALMAMGLVGLGAVRRRTRG